MTHVVSTWTRRRTDVAGPRDRRTAAVWVEPGSRPDARPLATNGGVFCEEVLRIVVYYCASREYGRSSLEKDWKYGTRGCLCWRGLTSQRGSTWLNMAHCSIWLTAQPGSLLNMAHRSTWLTAQLGSLLSVVYCSAWFTSQHGSPLNMAHCSTWFTAQRNLLLNVTHCSALSVVQCSLLSAQLG